MKMANPFTPLLWAVTLLIVMIQIAPLVVVVLVSFANSPVFEVTFGNWSLRWWERMATARGFWAAMELSARLAALSTAVALVLGTAAALAIHRGRFPGAALLGTILLSPLMLPGIVLGIAVSQMFRAYGVTDAFTALAISHVVVVMPFVVRIMLSSLALFDFTMVEAARTLGCSYGSAILRVAVPNLAPGLVTSAVFGFIASFDNYPMSMFLVDARTKTLPIQMLEFLEESPNPTIAAVSTLLLVLTAVLLLIIHRVSGLQRAVIR